MDHEAQLRSLEAKFLMASSRTQLVTSFASVAINSIILANSAAAGALLAFLASLPKDQRGELLIGQSVYCLKVFTVGSFLGILCALVGYLSQSLFTYSDLAVDGSAREKKFMRFARACHVIALVCGALGALCFPLGALSGLNALGLWR